MSSNWIDAAAEADVPEDDVTQVAAGGVELALYGAGGEVYATASLCTHGNARLCDGFLDGHEIECPLHQGKFDIRDGRATCEPATEAVRTYPVKIENGRVYVDLG
ncbi:non-heme iron oxygenase ferredoxin subunit [Pseudoduganella namucuonensis]|uniref:Naphthalene 1,2-dioxygenase system ferredoxin subunit n=1 Tax=Pseudoduganella namucuonensis TaxID=1035707 RepID=A0A1I7H078_9BURK|nr:non-heme iron oxygenase ferredoxin subunit [Pseudoduganella namucuonensis]SFU53906.1 naphthalene 1,2-dioxygenase system ferredoxin subunit [Pseudoduganella namucuonensis]